jgi:WD40 repeat protein
MSTDGRTLASAANDGTITLSDVATGQERTTRKRHGVRSWVNAAFSPDGSALASVGWVEPVGWAEIKLWDTVTGQERATLTGLGRGDLKGLRGDINCLALSPDGTTLAAGGTIWDGNEPRGHEVKLWDVTTGRERAALVGLTQGIVSVAFSPDGTVLATGGTDGSVELWDVVTGKGLRALPKSPGRSVLAMAFSPDGTTLAAGNGVPYADQGGGELKLWDVATGRVRAELRTNAGHIRCVAFSPDGKLLAGACKDGTAKLWYVSPLTTTAGDALRPQE